LPRIRFANLPPAVWQHILDRVDERKITLEDLQKLQTWARSNPEAPAGDWFKDFGSFKICGTGELPKTVLMRHMKPFGAEII
jgi:hypothetical protein